MLLRDRFEHQGTSLFRWRSYWPFLIVPLVLVALPQSGYLEAQFGETAETIWDVLCIAIAFTGQAMRVATVGYAPAGTSGRNTTSQRAERLNTTGLYSVVRNPLYVGNVIVLIGFALATKVWWFPLLVVALALLFYERIILTEEAFLLGKFGNTYRDWAVRTPAMMPRLGHWQPPDLPFSARTAIRREFHGVQLIVVVMTVIEFLSDVIGEGEPATSWPRQHPGWMTFLAVSTVIYLVVRLIRKRTHWLVVEGR